MYNPDSLIEEYEQLAHGRTRLAGIRHAIEEADRNGDLPFMAYFREEFCSESCFYGDNLDLLIMFPQLLALVDENPGLPSTRYNSNFDDSLDHVLWIYKWVVESCEEFYQISMKDSLGYYEDYKKRCLAYGYNLKAYYEYLYSFYESIDKVYSEECFYSFERLPRDGHSNCRACERNVEIEFYLKHGNPDKARKKAADIEAFSLTCGGRGDMDAWLRMKHHFMRYYMRQRDYGQAADYCRLMERKRNDKIEYDYWDDFVECYAYADVGKSLRIYKQNWKKLLKLRCPKEIMDQNRCCSIFFRELMRERAGDTIKIAYDPDFPLFREDGQYEIAQLYHYHYSIAREAADKFDARNGTDYYKKGLEADGIYPIGGE